MKNVILHLSDIQFGRHYVEKPGSRKPLYANEDYTSELKKLITDLDLLKNNHGVEPNFIVVSGDIAEWSKEEEYKQAETFLGGICNHIGLDRSHVILTPGNHDINRKLCQAARLMAEAENKVFEPPYFPKFRFYQQFFNNFYKDQEWSENITPYNFSEDLFVVFPFPSNNIIFAGLNSCVDESEEKHYGNISIDQVEKANKELDVYDKQHTMLRIVVFHHNFLRCSDNDEENLKDADQLIPSFVSGNFRIMLHGHRHVTQKNVTGEGNNIIHILATGSAGLDSETLPDNCRRYQVIEIDDDQVRIYKRWFDTAAYSGQGCWKPDVTPSQTQIYDEFSLTIANQKTTKVEVFPLKQSTNNGPQGEEISYEILIKQASEYAFNYIKRKSQAITKGNIPAFLERKIAVHNAGQKVGTTRRESQSKQENGDQNTGELILDSKNNLIPLAELLNEGKPVFLFGELGSGKSTAVGLLLQRHNEATSTIVPLLVPAGYFNDKSFSTASEVENLILRYASEQIFLGSNSNIGKALEGIDIILVIDGFDELNIKKSKDLLTFIEDIAYAKNNIRVIATGRPVELYGLNYDRWKCAIIPPLEEVEKLFLLVNEALALGFEEEQAKEDARRKLKILKDNPELLSISNTPLAVRLLWPHLTDTAISRTLGDLLYDIISERLNWDDKSGKASIYPQFESAYPDGLSRETLLGRIAAAIYNSPSKSIAKEALHQAISTNIGNVSEKPAVVSQAVQFFLRNILQESDNLISFPLQPLFQISTGLYIANQLLSSQAVMLEGESKNLWREYSFAATIARRKQAFASINDKFQNYISEELGSQEEAVVVALIIYEAKDSVLATNFIRLLNTFDFRPIRILGDMQSLSELAFAYTIRLSGKVGFDWFFGQYLDPRYPFGMADYRIADNILKYWVLLGEYKTESYEEDAFKDLYGKILSVGALSSYYISKTLVLILPGEYSQKDRINLYIDNLNSPLFQSHVYQLLIDEAIQGQKNLISNLIAQKYGRHNSSANAIRLWLELNPKATPPLEIIQASVIESALNANNSIFEALKDTIGLEKLVSVLKLYVSYSERIATAAAILLNRLGETSLSLLGDGLTRGLHDGGKFPGAEELLTQLIRTNGKVGIQWIADRFTPEYTRFDDGAFSGYWRIFLTELIESNELYLDEFASVIYFVGEFNLPRYPEIRHAFQQLLKTKPEYYAKLKQLLQGLSISLRYNSACILFSSYPESEVEAAEIVINSAQKSYNHYEWHEFCTKLVLGQAVKEQIVAQLNNYDVEQKTFALMLLFRNEYPLTEELYKQLITGLLKYNFDISLPKSSNHEPILSYPRAKKILCDCLQSQGEVRKNAAYYLWNYHRPTLDAEQWSLCLLLNAEGISLYRLSSQIEQNVNNSSLAQKAEALSQVLIKERLREPIGCIYLRTFSDPNAWKDLIWAMIMQDDASSSWKTEELLWIISKGLKSSEAAKAIGETAVGFLDQVSNQINAKLAFALLAHEFATIEENLIEKLLLYPSNRINKEVVIALISRIRRLPDGYKVPEGQKIEGNLHFALPMTLDQAIEATRDIGSDLSDRLQVNESILLCLENILVTGVLTPEELSILDKKGILSLWCVTIIRFCRKTLDDYEWAGYLIGKEFSKLPQGGIEVDVIFSRFLEIIVSCISEDEQNRSQYVKSLLDSLKSGIATNIVAICQELIKSQERLDIELLSTLLKAIVDHTHRLDTDLVNFISEYLVNLEEKDKELLLPVITQMISNLYYKQSRFSTWMDGLNYWFFSISAMYLKSSLDKETIAVFLRGLQSMFIYQFVEVNQSFKRKEPIFYANTYLSAISPIFQKVPRELIRQCIEQGLESDVTEIVVCCRMLNTLIRT